MKKELQRMKKAIFGGLSYMIPLVAGSGLIMAIGCIMSIMMGHDPTGSSFAWSIDGNVLDQLANCRIDQLIWWTGKFGLNLMPAFLAGYVANGLAGKPGIAPGFVIGWLAGVMNGSFIGGIVAGLLVGYIARWCKEHIKLRGAFRSLLSFSIIPLICLIAGSIVYRYTIGLVIMNIMNAMYSGLTMMNADPSLRVLLGVVLGAMICADFGGPINKTAILFVYGVYAETVLPSTYAHIALAVPNVALLITYLLNKKVFSEGGKENVISNFVLGMFGIGENTIPFAVSKPALVVPCMVVGGATAGGLAALFNLSLLPTLGYFMGIPFMVATEGFAAGLYMTIAFFGGSLVAALLMTLIIRTKYAKNEKPIFFENDEAGLKL
ncbi:fructose-specific PTS transporter subunit EIIC [Floccifex sp.]|uniref:fructose-specific PTS transporter subunit EIIC n=1 Tax=Floccifex sp. TaxID=2815810 RepID=UPI003F085518